MIVQTMKELRQVFKSAEQSNRFCLDLETVDRGFPDTTITGVGIGWSVTQGAYIPVGHAQGLQLPLDVVLTELKAFLERNKHKIGVLHNAIYDMKNLAWHGGIKFHRNVFDTMVASWLVDTENPHGLKPLVERYTGYKMTELDEFTPTEIHPVTGDEVYRTDLVSIEEMAKYAIDDVTKPLELMDIFLPIIMRDGLLKAFADLEMPKLEVLTHMTLMGVKLDKQELQKQFELAPNRLKEVEEAMYKLRPSGEPFNVNSPKQLNQVLFDECGIPPMGSVGKNGLYSTKAEYMEKWALKYPIAESILEARKLTKLLGTYLKGLSNRLGQDGRIRTRFNPILVTGRLSSSKPNLQNIPKPENDRFGLRSMFIAEDGRELIVADFSQIELRVLAHISKDPVFVKAYVNGEDLHSYAAQILFNLDMSLDEIKKNEAEKRGIGKTFNFATVYEAGDDTLASGAKVSVRKAQQLKQIYFNRFKGIAQYIEDAHAMAEKYGYVTTITNRRRHLRDAQLPGKTRGEKIAKSKAFRQASNTMIQGSAADIISIAMRNVYYRLEREGLLCTDPRSNKLVKMELQVHDELMLSAEAGEQAVYAKQILVEEMENAVKLRVPLVSEAAIGKRWSDCK